MAVRTIATYLLVLIAIVLVFKWGTSPLRTRLPFGSADLTSVEPQLSRLSAQDQQLVRDYVARSRGDYLPARFADPDAPFTARTFGDAIKLQRRYLATLDTSRDERRAYDAKRDAILAPLRAVLQLELVERAMTPVTGPLPPASQDLHGAKAALPDTRVEAVTRWRVRNVSTRVVASFAGAATAYRRDADALLPERLNDCYIEEARALAPGAFIDVGCADSNRDAAWNSRYLAMPASALRVDWMPRRITFADGTELKYDGN